MCVITTQNAFLPSFTSGFEKPHNTLKSCAREKRKVDAIISPIYPSIMFEERPFKRNNIIQKPFLTLFIQGQLGYFALYKLVLCKSGLSKYILRLAVQNSTKVFKVFTESELKRISFVTRYQSFCGTIFDEYIRSLLSLFFYFLEIIFL